MSKGEATDHSTGPEPQESLETRARKWVALVDSRGASEWIPGMVLDGRYYVEDLLDALEASESRLRALRRENEELRAENNAHRAWLVEGFLQEVHDPKKGPMTIEDARKYLRKLADDALGASREATQGEATEGESDG